MTFAERKAMRVFAPSQLCHTVAGRMEQLTEWLLGPELCDENGEPTGERGAPLIDQATYNRLSFGSAAVHV